MAKTPAPKGGPGGRQGHGYQRPQNLRGTVLRLVGYISQYKLLLILVALCLVISSLASVASSYLMKPIINNYIIPGDFSGLLKMVSLLFGCFALSAGCSYTYARI
ncbi:MAG: hypothetical protein IKA48_16700, partial [Fibrobacter sp.]|nr:hypothetical protein [Fibrobacter sp.]